MASAEHAWQAQIGKPSSPRAVGTPLDVMLDNVRWADQEAAKILANLLSPEAPTDTTELLETLLRLRERAAEWAKDAAPLCASTAGCHRAPACGCEWPAADADY
jgi:hypothetical protein